MVDFTEIVKWDDASELQNNLSYGLNRPRLENILVRPEGLTVAAGTARFGKALYKYDFGRNGTVTEFRFDSTPLVKFRLKMANTITALSQANFLGTDEDRFMGTIIDAAKYVVVPNVYTVAQNGSINIGGTQSGSGGIFEDPARLSLIAPLSDTYSVNASVRLVVDEDETHDSGSFAFLELDNGINNIQVQKHYAQVRSKIVDFAGNDLGRDVNDNDIILGEDIGIAVNSIHSETTTVLTDGRFGIINDIISDPITVDEFSGLKDVDEAVNFFGRTTLQHNCVRVLGLRADFSLTGILADLQQGLIYEPKRTHGYYAMRVPIVNPRIDLFANDVRSLNFNSRSGQYELAEVDDRWATTILIPAGTHYYAFLVDGQTHLDPLNPNTVSIASGIYSGLTVESTRFVQFVFHGPAKKMSVIGTFNNFNSSINSMEVGFDPSEILKIHFGGHYCNNHPDWHMVEVVFEKPTPVMAIRFLTSVPFEQKQRVRILLDDAPITRDEWEIRCTPEAAEEPGVSECATYSNLLATGASEECLSYFDNNTDTITASEDGWVEWHFLANNPVNNREIKFYKKLSFMTRLENHSLFQRKHRGLELLAAEDFVAKVTDFLVSDNELPFRAQRRTQVCPEGVWSISQLVLHPGINMLTPVQILGEGVTYGDSVSVVHNQVKSFIEPFNQSGVALNNTEVACTLAAQLTQELTSVKEVVDTPAEGYGYGYGPGPSPDPRFTRESFTRASDRLRVVVINASVTPVRTYFLHLVGQATNFLFELYETESDAHNRTNRVGYATSSSYGFQVIPVFVAERQINTPAGLQDVDVVDIIVCFDEHAANTVFKNTPRANI
jgi:hypothetical protein